MSPVVVVVAAGKKGLSAGTKLGGYEVVWGKVGDLPRLGTRAGVLASGEACSAACVYCSPL